jgi:tetratricopeptide (TPR) repeat protein
MLKKDRRAIHGRIVQVLERDYSVIVGQLPEVVGRHCEAAQLTEKAIRYFIQAGANAIRRSANIEALGHLRRGLRLIRENPDMAETRALRLELEIQSTIGTPLIAVEGYTSRETIRAFERARDISDRTGDVAARFRALFGLWGHRWMAGHLDLSRQLATEMLAIADDDDDPEHVIIAHRCMGSSHWAAGDFAETREHLSKVTRLTEATDTTVLANKYAVCPCVVSQVLGGYGMWFQEERTEGIQSVRAGLNRAYAMNHAYSIALAHSISAGLGWLGDDMAELKEHTAALRSIAEDRRFPYWRAYADTLEGATLARQGNCTEAISRIEASMAFYDRLGVFLHRSMQLVLLSDAELRAGNPDLAERLLDEAVAFGNRTGERQWFSVIEQRRALVGGV